MPSAYNLTGRCVEEAASSDDGNGSYHTDEGASGSWEAAESSAGFISAVN
jgi:hypothetical protein